MLLRPASLALAAALACAPAVVSADPAPTPIVEKTDAPVAADRQETTHYAQREQQDPKVADYQGGSIFVIGISGTALLVILLALILL